MEYYRTANQNITGIQEYIEMSILLKDTEFADTEWDENTKSKFKNKYYSKVTLYTSDMLIHGNGKGKVAAKDKDGNKFLVAKDEPRLKDGTLVGISSGTIWARDSTGKGYRVKPDDPRLQTGELIRGKNYNSKTKLVLN